MVRRIFALAVPAALVVAGCAQRTAETVAAPAGLSAMIAIMSPLDTATTEAGAPLLGTLLEPITVGGALVVPAGARLYGTVIRVVPGDSVQAPALTVRYGWVEEIGGPARPFPSEPLVIEGALPGGGSGEGEVEAGDMPEVLALQGGPAILPVRKDFQIGVYPGTRAVVRIPQGAQIPIVGVRAHDDESANPPGASTAPDPRAG